MNKNKTIITKENIINSILQKSNDDYISTEDLMQLVASVTDEDGIISRKKLFKSLRNTHTKSVIKNIYNSFEDIIFDSLSSVSEEQDVCIKLFEGVSIDGTYVPEGMKKNNLTGEVAFVESKIKPKFNITRSYCEKLNKK